LEQVIQEISEIAIYQTDEGGIQFKTDVQTETLWATQRQMANVFGVDVRTVNEHVVKIYKSNELDQDATIRKFRIVQKEGKREVERNVNHYNLDMLISVGYRVNSKTATKFRQWATKTLKQHISEGYTVNQHLLDIKKLKCKILSIVFNSLLVKTYRYNPLMY